MAIVSIGGKFYEVGFGLTKTGRPKIVSAKQAKRPLEQIVQAGLEYAAGTTRWKNSPVHNSLRLEGVSGEGYAVVYDPYTGSSSERGSVKYAVGKLTAIIAIHGVYWLFSMGRAWKRVPGAVDYEEVLDSNEARQAVADWVAFVQDYVAARIV